jgi:hypothetical protein
MAVWKRYNGKRIKGEGPKGKGTWIVEFRLRGHYVKQAIPEARTRAEAEQAQIKLKRDIFDDKYNRAAGNKDFTEFVDEVFVPWAKASKRSWQDDEERARPLKEFFAGKRLRDITPMNRGVQATTLEDKDVTQTGSFARDCESGATSPVEGVRNGLRQRPCRNQSDAAGAQVTRGAGA